MFDVVEASKKCFRKGYRKRELKIKNTVFDEVSVDLKRIYIFRFWLSLVALRPTGPASDFAIKQHYRGEKKERKKEP